MLYKRFLDLLWIIPEEIMIQSLRNSQKQIGIDWFLSEDIIDIGTRAVYLARKPRRSALLAQHLFFYYFTDVYHKRRNRLLQIFNWGTAKHRNADKHKQFTPRRYELSSCLFLRFCKLAVFSWGNRAKSSKIICIKNYLSYFIYCFVFVRC